MDTTATLRPGIYVAGTAVCPKGYPGQRGVGWIGSNAGIPGCRQVAVSVNSAYTLWWDRERESICYIDQTLLPNRERIAECRSVRRLAKAIQRLEIRGAPALGVAGAFGVALSASVSRHRTHDGPFFQPYHAMQKCSGQPARPRSTSGGALTACWIPSGSAPTVADARERALAEAEKIFLEDTACCHAIGEHGASLLPDTCTDTHPLQCRRPCLLLVGDSTRGHPFRGGGRKKGECDRLRDPAAPAGCTSHGMGTVTGRYSGHGHHGFHGRPLHAD